MASGLAETTIRTRARRGEAAGLTAESPMIETSDAPPPGAATSTLYDEHGNVKLQWVKLKESQRQFNDALIAAAEELKEDLPRAARTKAPRKADYNQKLMSVIPWGDPHFGLYCWAEEVGSDFNIDIARRDLCDAVRHLVSLSPASARCVIVNLGDFFHSDTNLGTTTKGTRLDTDTRLAKVVRVGVAAIRQAITSALERHHTVEIINAIGNHDEVLSMCLSIMLAHIYENEPRVVVHDMPTRRHYLTHGKVLIGVTHGDKQKENALPGIMATEKPREWGASTYRYWYKGHLHHDKKTEYNGATVEMFRTLAPNDEYATSGGWLSMHDMKLICHHEDYGEVSRVTCSLNMLRDIQGGKK
jgi:hypothetical protein